MKIVNDAVYEYKYVCYMPSVCYCYIECFLKDNKLKYNEEISGECGIVLYK